MKCRLCNYETGWNGELQKAVDGDEGEFYKTVYPLERGSDFSGIDKADVIGCPKCYGTFMLPYGEYC